MVAEHGGAANARSRTAADGLYLGANTVGVNQFGSCKMGQRLRTVTDANLRNGVLVADRDAEEPRVVAALIDRRRAHLQRVEAEDVGLEEDAQFTDGRGGGPP